MAFQVSPGVSVSEVDLSTTIPSASVSDAGFAGYFSKGPVNQIVNIGSENDLVNIFGKPNKDNNSNWLTVSSFLAYGGSINIVRLIGNNTRSASFGAGAADAGTFTTVDSFGTWSDGDTAVSADIKPIADGSESGWTVEYTLAQTTGDITVTSVNKPAGSSLTAPFNTRIVGIDAVVTVNPDNLSTATVVWQDLVGTEANNDLSSAITDITSTLQDAGVDPVFGTPALTVTDTNGTVLSSGTLATLSASGLAVVAAAADSADAAIISIVQNSSIVVKNRTEFEASYELGSAAYELVAQSAGEWGSSLKVKFDQEADSEIGAGLGSSEAHIQVTLGTDSNGNDIVVETHRYVNMEVEDSTDEQGNNNYYKNVLNTKSEYVFAGNTPITSITEKDLAGGVDNDYADVRSYELFEDSEQVDLSLVITGADDANDVTTDLATDRKDCVAFVSPSKNSVITSGSLDSKASAVIGDKPDLLNSYGFMDSGWKKMYDKYNDTWVNVPLNGDMAGLCVATDNNREPWYSPAGFNRGQIRNCAGLLFDPNKSSRDTLYKNNVNPVASFPGEGYVLFGDKTLQTKPSAFDRLNVRRLFIVIEKAISSASKYSLFEFNDEFTRGQFRSMVDPFLRDIKARRGIHDYLLVCDESNNTPDIVDNNEFVGDIFIKPARSINFIQLNFVAVKTGVSFSEIVGAV